MVAGAYLAYPLCGLTCGGRPAPGYAVNVPGVPAGCQAAFHLLPSAHFSLSGNNFLEIVTASLRGRLARVK